MYQCVSEICLLLDLDYMKHPPSNVPVHCTVTIETLYIQYKKYIISLLNYIAQTNVRAVVKKSKYKKTPP